MTTQQEQLKHFFQNQNKKFEKCLEPLMKCSSKPIRAHSIQNAKVFDLLERNGHLVMPKQTNSKAGPEIIFDEVGRNSASTFTGLCSRHDQEIFRPIDTKPFNIKDQEQLFLLAYRSICRELHVIMEGAMRLQTTYKWKVEEGEVNGDSFSPEAVLATEHLMKSYETWKYRCKFFDQKWAKKQFGSITHTIWVMKDQNPTIAVSSLFSFPGSSSYKDLIRCALNVFPLNEEKTIVVLSYPRAEASKVLELLKPFRDANEEDRKVLLSKLIVSNVENFVISPDYYDGWPAEKKAIIREAFVSTLFSSEADQTYPDFSLF